MTQNRVIMQQQCQQPLWRPSGELLHLLTERKPQAVDLEELHSRITIPQASARVEESAIAKRQAPAVWMPPLAMKANCPLAPPVEDEWQLSKQEEPSSSSYLLLDEKRSSNYTAADSDHDQENHCNNVGNDCSSDLRNLMGSRTDSSGNGRHSEMENGPRNELSTSTDEELMPAPRTVFGEASKLFHVSSSLFSSPQVSSKLGMVASPFMKQQAVAQTPLFSGLGSVSFGSGAGFLQSPATSIFAQSPPLAFGRSLRNSEDEEHKNQAPQQTSTVKFLSTTNSASEKGSSDSLAGRTGVAAESNGGFRPSGLAGKSLLPEAPPKAAKSSNAGGRKLRTRPLDLLMNAIQATAPAKATRLSSRISNAPGAQLNANATTSSSAGAEAQAGGPTPTGNTKNSRAPRPRRNNSSVTEPSSSRSDHSQKPQDQQQDHKQQEQQEQQQQEQQRRTGAFFAHTGVWIVQKKSSRHTRSAFKKNILDSDQHQQEQQNRRASNGREHQRAAATSSSKPTSTKKRSLAAISTPQPEAKQPRRQQTKAGTRSVDDDRDRKRDEKEDDDEDDGQGRDRGARRAPLIRSKRGRSQALPTRLRDSVLNKVKKTTRKEIK